MLFLRSNSMVLLVRVPKQPGPSDFQDAFPLAEIITQLAYDFLINKPRNQAARRVLARNIWQIIDPQRASECPVIVVKQNANKHKEDCLMEKVFSFLIDEPCFLRESHLQVLIHPSSRFTTVLMASISSICRFISSLFCPARAITASYDGVNDERLCGSPEKPNPARLLRTKSVIVG